MKNIATYRVTTNKYSSEFFPGSGTSFGDYASGAWDNAATGIGRTYKEGFDNAVELIKKRGYDVRKLTRRMHRPRSTGETSTSGKWFYVTIKVKDGR